LGDKLTEASRRTICQYALIVASRISFRRIEAGKTIGLAPDSHRVAVDHFDIGHRRWAVGRWWRRSELGEQRYDRSEDEGYCRCQNNSQAW